MKLLFNIALILAVSVCLLIHAQGAHSADPTPEQVEFFRTKIEPVLKRECYKCHSQQAKKVQGEFLLDNRDSLNKGGPSGRAIVPGKSGESLLISALRHIDYEMPPEKQLSKEIIADFVYWVDDGAIDPRDGPAAEIAEKEYDYSEGRKFWSFQPLAETAVPNGGANAKWARSDIDRFILARMNEMKLSPNPAAEKRTLIRRVYFDLIGLPPTPEEVDQFVNDPSPDAYAKLVDRLLENEHYGERWGRHWLDVARFGESHGYEADNDRPQAFVYRDAVIKSLNQDLPYDTFVKWQIAGDEFDPKNELARQLTGFCGAGPTLTNEGGDRVKYEKLDDVVSATGEAFLGLTIGCARCHDHKFDPISAKDYYRFAGVFETMKVDGNTGQVSEGTRSPRQSYFLYRGNYRSKSKIEYGFLNVLMPADKAPEFWVKEPPKEINSTYLRHSMAEWMTDTEAGAGNVLARVIVNRLWQHHFGDGLVRTTSDFGAQGAPPTHPELLDFLAHQLIKEGWKLKPIHRLMMNSSTYMQSTVSDAKKRSADPENKWLARRRPMRLEAEIVRDNLLAVSGCLNPQMYGASIKPWVPTDAISTGSTKKWPVNVKDGPGTWRRSVYIYAKRSMLMPMLQAFDFPDTTKSCAVRNETTVAPAALLLMNNEFIRDQAKHLADRIIAKAGDDSEKQVHELYRIALSRPASDDESKLGTAFLATQSQSYAGTKDETPNEVQPEHRKSALVNYCQAVMGLNEFIYIE
jgi:hypothetical protein